MSDKPDYFKAEPRQLGKLNAGFYCTYCGEFITTMVIEPPNETKFMELVKLQGLSRFECAYCHHVDRYDMALAERLHLTESNQRQPRQ